MKRYKCTAMPGLSVALGDTLSLTAAQTQAVDSVEYFGPFEYFATDHLGSVRVVKTAGEGIVQRRNYYPYGLLFPDKPNATGIAARIQPYTTTGKELDTHYSLTSAPASTCPTSGSGTGWTTSARNTIPQDRMSIAEQIL